VLTAYEQWLVYGGRSLPDLLRVSTGGLTTLFAPSTTPFEAALLHEIGTGAGRTTGPR